MSSKNSSEVTRRLGCLDRFFCWCAQADPDVVLQGEKLALISMAHAGMGVVSVALLNGILVVFSVSGIPGVGPAFGLSAGGIVFIAVFLIDRSIIGSMINSPAEYQRSAWRNPSIYIAVFARLVVAVVIAHFIANLFVLAVSQKSIVSELERFERHQNAAVFEKRDDAIRNVETVQRRIDSQEQALFTKEQGLRSDEALLLQEIGASKKARSAAVAAAKIEEGGEGNSAGLKQLEGFEFSSRRGDGTRTRSFRSVADLHGAEIAVAEERLTQLRGEMQRLEEERSRLNTERSGLPSVADLNAEHLVASEMVSVGRDLVALAQGYELLKANPALGKGTRAIEVRLHLFLIVLDAGLILLLGFMSARSTYPLRMHAVRVRAANEYRKEFSAGRALSGGGAASRFEFTPNQPNEPAPNGHDGVHQ